MLNSKKGSLLCGFILSLTLILAACGNNQTPASQNSSSSSEAPSSPGASASPSESSPAGTATASEEATRTVKHLMGETKIPAHPQRIVADQYLGHLLALGIKPVGARGDILKSPFLQDQIDGIVDTGSSISPEKVLELKPDLIILQEGELYEQMSKIAPTIVFEYGKLNTLEQLELFGDILGKQTEAAAWKSRFDAKAAAYREQLAQTIGKDETVSIIELWAEGPFVFGNNWGRGGFSLYNALGLKAPKIIEDEILDKEQYRMISMEVLPDYAGDYVFLTVYAENNGDLKAKEIQNDPIWKSLPAYKNNRIFLLNIDDMAAGDPISLEKQMDIQVAKLLEAKS